MQPSVLGQALDRRHLVTGDLFNRGHAGSPHLPVDENSAGAAFAFAAAVLGPRELQIVAQDEQQGVAGLGVDRLRSAVDAKGELSHRLVRSPKSESNAVAAPVPAPPASVR